jgi:hypothetical protein
MVETLVTVSRFRRLPAAGLARDAGCRGSVARAPSTQVAKVAADGSPWQFLGRSRRPSRRARRNRQRILERAEARFSLMVTLASGSLLTPIRVMAGEQGARVPPLTGTICYLAVREFEPCPLLRLVQNRRCSSDTMDGRRAGKGGSSEWLKMTQNGSLL